MAWHGMAWHGKVWHGIVWHQNQNQNILFVPRGNCMVWHGMV